MIPDAPNSPTAPPLPPGVGFVIIMAGATTLLAFENGLVNAAEVISIRNQGDGRSCVDLKRENPNQQDTVMLKNR
jgi:hypothetical protein